MAAVTPKVTQVKQPFATAWFSIAEKWIDDERLPYYSLQMQDYVTVFATTASDKIILVRQYRPAVENFVLELPSGHVEKDETPEAAARKELLEETGYVAEPLLPLGTLLPDTGRLGNKLWAFFAPRAIRSASWTAEKGVNAIEFEHDDFCAALTDGRFPHALHLGVVMAAVAKGHWRL